MTQRPRITFAPIYPGANEFDNAFLGGLCVGRVHSTGKGGSWICWLPKPNGLHYSNWREEKSVLAAKNALIDEVLKWLAIGGLTVAEAPT